MQNTQKIDGKFKGKNILSLDQFDTTSLKILFDLAYKMEDIAKNSRPSDVLKGNIVSLLFYEPSSRTFGSFAAAIKQLGGSTLEFQDMSNTSVAKGETLEDTVRVFQAYSDALILRHPEVGATKIAAEVVDTVPLINAGNGVGEHPTQALLDLYTIYKKFGTLENLTLLIAGDIKNGRTVHSLLRGLALYKGNTVYLLSPRLLRLDSTDLTHFKGTDLTLHEITKEQDIPKNANVWYWTRIQKERFVDISEYERVKNTFIVTPEFLNKYGNDDLILMHPLPRVGEIDPQVDSDKRAIYLRQEIQNGMYIRMALLTLILGKEDKL